MPSSLSPLSLLGQKLKKGGLLLASANSHKIREMQEMLRPLNITVRTITELASNFPPLSVEESGPDFQSNAVLKAQAYYKSSGCISLADDSGLVVDALGGKPGVYSARYGGPGLNDVERNLLLLKELEGVPFEKRTARFVCVLALCMGSQSDESCLFEGKCEGYITEEIQGEKGFGYDPVFFDLELKQSFAQIESFKKNERSHRFQAIQKFIGYLYKDKREHGPFTRS